MLSFARDTVSVLRPALVLVHGSYVSDWESVTRVMVRRCLVQPADTREVTENRDLTVGTRRVLMPPGTDVKPYDRLELPSETGAWEIVGEPRPWRSPTGGLSHVEVLVNRWTEGRY